MRTRNFTVSAVLLPALFTAAPQRSLQHPLIPRAVFFGYPEHTAPNSSPDGRQIAYERPERGHMEVWVRTLGANDDHAVKDRVFVRSWSVKPRGWYRTFLKEPRGTVQVAGFEMAVRAVRIRDERLRDAVDRAYLEKYNKAGALKYARDLGSAKSRGTTTELVPLSSTP